MLFQSEAHRKFYEEKILQLHADVYLRALIYTVGICPDTRKRWECFYNETEHEIKPEVISRGWQTGTSVKLTRLAFQLFTDSTPTAYGYNEHYCETRDFDECQRYSISDIFCCEYAPFFMQAVKLRYSEYFIP